MRRRRIGHTNKKSIFNLNGKYIIRWISFGCILIIGSKFCLSQLPQIGKWLYDMTLVSAAMIVPEGTVEFAKERFEQELLEHLDGEEISYNSENKKQSDKNNDDFQVTKQNEAPPIEDIPEESRGVIVSKQYKESNSSLYIPFGRGFIKNSTKLSREKVQDILNKPLEMKIENTNEPQVLIMHTHATESYAEYDANYYDKRSATWRSRDESKNVVKLGAIITEELNNAGIVTIHDKTQHDYPSYNGSYDRSQETIKKYLEKYPSIKVVIDVHRDAIQTKDGTVYKAVSDINGEKTAQVMIISGCDDGTMGMPEWDKNLRFASVLQSTMESLYPGITRPVFFCYRKYNQHLTNGSLLLEFGSHGNTLQECERTAHYVGRALAKTLNDLKK